MKKDYLTLEWKTRQKMYAKEYDHLTIDTAETLYGLLQQCRLLALLKESRGSVLDVGCANSPLTSWLVARGHLVVGVDIVIPPKMPKTTPRCNFICCVAEYLPFRWGSFDTILMGEIIEHLLEPHKVFAEAFRVSKRKILLSTPNSISNPLAKHSPDHFRSFSYKTLLNFLKDFCIEVRLINQPIFLPLPTSLQRILYVWAKKRYVVQRRPLKTAALTSRIIRTVIILSKEISRLFPVLSTTLIVDCKKKNPN